MRNISATDYQIASALDNRIDTTNSEICVIDEIINAWNGKRDPEAGTISALYAICSRLGINVF